MTAPETPALSGMSIGAVLDLLRPDFPDVTISKIRFLEAEGLVTPQRAASGYRRFTAYDCARLRFILTAQRDQYLPLKVIKAQLDAQPDGELPLAGSPYGVPRLVSVGDEGSSAPTADSGSGRRRPASGSAEKTCWSARGRRRVADGAAQGRGDHHRAGRIFRRARGGDPAVRPGARRLRCRAASPAGIPLGRRPAIRPDRADRRAPRQARPARPAPATAPTTSHAKSPPSRSRCTPR